MAVIEVTVSANSASIAPAYDRDKVKVVLSCEPCAIFSRFTAREILAVMDEDEFLQEIGEIRARAYWGIGA